MENINTVFEDNLHHNICEDKDDIMIEKNTASLVSKPKKEKKIREMSKITYEIDYKYFFKNKPDLRTFKLDELKFIAKKYHLKFSGTKPILIDRITHFFIKTREIIKIQSLFRKWVVLYLMNHRGPAFKNRSICTNDTDFVTMEPLNEIPDELFYSYRDSQNFIYGFNLSSLIQTLRMKNKLSNPYNRENIPEDEVKKIIRLYNFSFIIYPELSKEYEKFFVVKPRNVTNTNRFIPQPMQPLFRNIDNNHLQELIHNIQNINEDIFRNNNNVPVQPPTRMQPIINNNEYNVQYRDYVPQIMNMIEITDDQENRLNRLRELRNLPITQRINNLFIEIDSLGNYTQSSWFHNLSRNDLVILYRNIYDIWYYRGNLSREVRYRICPYRSPFYNINGNGNIRNLTLNMTTEDIKMLCLIVFENLVYTGVDDDHRRIGTFHALSALTIVSIGARTSLPWLYESVVF